MLPALSLALAAAAASSLLLFLTPTLIPRMPLYRLTSLHFSTVSLSYSSLWTPTNISISATLVAGVQIENENIMGADIYSTIIDLYYPDWSGDLQHIGILRETKAVLPSSTTEEEKYQCWNDIDNGGDGDDVCIEPRSPPPTSAAPFFTIDAQGTSISDAGVVSITLTDIAPKTYLKLLSDAFTARGVIEVQVSGGAHVRPSLLGGRVPLTLGLTCNNDLELFRFPAILTGKDCVVRGLRTGWVGLEEYAFELRGQTLRRYEEKRVPVVR